jgi:hypothetical protein
MAAVPPDFLASSAIGAVPGVQSKVLAQREGERFEQDDRIDLDARHQMCEDLAQQLVRYSARKRADRPDWTPAQVREKVTHSVRQKAFGWGLSPAETEWVVRRLASLDPGAPPAGSATS